MYQDNIVLCGASSYEQKYYFNQDFASLPDAVKQELQIMCVLKEIQRNKKDLLESLEMYYKVFFLGDIPDEELKKKADAVED